MFSLYRPLGLLCLVALASACTAEPDPLSVAAETSTQPVVYGDDDREDYYASESVLFRQRTLDAIVAQVPRGALDESNPDDIQIVAASLQDSYNLCDDQRFLDQPTAARCSATLIDDDLVLTAGHCVSSDAECTSYVYVFDYFYEAEGELATISSDDVYECDQLVVQALGGGLDYAILQLDRPVTGRAPAPVRREDTALSAGDSVPVIGFGSGLPAKIDLGGTVLDGRPGTLDFFVTTNDTFGGNSGSGVFTADGDVVGILVRGETDYVSNGGCNVVNELPDPPSGGRGEDVSYVARALEHLCIDENFPSARLCGGPTGEGWCDPCESDEACPDGWTCQAEPGLDGTYCATPCADDSDCRDDHSCGDTGFCSPDRQPRCFGGDVWLYDSCGRQVLVADDCGPAEVCSGGACQPRPAGDACTNPTTIEAVTQTLTGDLSAGYFADAQGSCAGAGPERIYTFAVEDPVHLTALAFGFDTTLYIRTACDDASSEIACNDDIDFGQDLRSRIAIDLEPGTYFLFMDAWSSNVGAYTLDLTFDYDYEPPNGNVCSDPTTISPVSQTLTGDLSADFTNNYEGSCAGRGPDRVYRFTLGDRRRLTALASGFDTTLYLRTNCTDPDSEVACNDDIDPGQDRRSQLDLILDPGTYYLFMDAWTTSGGVYNLELTFSEGCTSSCEAGDRRCLDEDVQICAPNTLGCTLWVTQACGPGLTCQDGVCVAGCVDQCSMEGARECLTDVRLHTCGDLNGDGCLEWGESEACPGGTLCSDGDCVCIEDCEEGVRRCSDDGLVEACIGTDAVCSSWVPVLECEGGTNCVEGECVLVCDDDCPFIGAQECTADGRVRRCGQFDDDDCLDWGPVESCPDGAACDADRCVPICGDECVTGDRRCNGNRVELCTISDEGCGFWLDQGACERDQTCSLGVCLDNCDNPCDVGERICDDSGTAVLECTEANGICPVFDVAEQCAANHVCADGECVSICEDACDEGARRCAADAALGEAIEVCEVGDDGCTDWRVATSCEDLGGCVDGECVEGCADECAPDGGAECVGEDAFRECSDLDDDGCLEWHLSTECPPGWRCVGDGQCVPSCGDDGFEPNNVAEEALLLEPGEYQGLFACPNDEDWFAVGLLADEELVVTLELEVDLGDLDLEIWREGDDVPLGGSYGRGTDVERLRYTSVGNEILLIRVFVIETSEGFVSYDLALTLGASPDDECQLDARRCSATTNGIEKCISGEDGRLVWSEPDPCGAERVCQDGACLGGIRPNPDAPDADIDASTGDAGANALAADGGCNCGVGPGSGDLPTAWLLVALGLVARRRRRRRR